jgi:uncharacterized protein YecT (DUF1311 family)
VSLWSRLLVVVPAALMAAQGLAHSAPPAGMVGTWDIVHVAVDGQDTTHQTYNQDDPRLMAGILVIVDSGVKLDPGDMECEKVPWSPHPISWQALIARGFPRPRVGGRSSKPTPDDFGLKLSPSAQTTAYSICPEPKTRFPTDTWAAISEPDSLLLRYDPQVLLVLKRRPPNARPAPSFDCARTTNPTEMTICKSFPLAAWDRSVALALKQVTEMFPERSDELKHSQGQWVRERNACGTNAKCIDDSLQNRVAALIWEQKT